MKYKIGDLVCHNENGEGIVINHVNLINDEKQTYVRFKNGIQRFAYNKDLYKKPGYITAHEIKMFDDMITTRSIINYHTDDFKHKEKTMTKEDLKFGMVVQYRNDDLRMMMPTSSKAIFVGEDGSHGSLELYREDLTNTMSADCDIVKIYGLVKWSFDALTTNIRDRTLIWERKEEVEMTMEEICKALGKTVKIVKEK